MTAQAGAVAADEREELLCYVDACADKLSREGFPIMGRTLKTSVRCLATPPAAVPVEALEGLVAEWRDQAKRLRNEVPNLRDGTDKRFAAACDADQAADELTQLIKERSNG